MCYTLHLHSICNVQGTQAESVSGSTQGAACYSVSSQDDCDSSQYCMWMNEASFCASACYSASSYVSEAACSAASPTCIWESNACEDSEVQAMQASQDSSASNEPSEPSTGKIRDAIINR